MLQRVIFSVVLFFLSFIGPWWVALLIGFALIFYFKNYFEFIAFALIIDSIHGSEFIYLKFPYSITLLSVGLFVLAISIKKRLIMYS